MVHRRFATNIKARASRRRGATSPATRDGLAVAFDGPGAGGWQSVPLDALPALSYQIVARVEATSGEGARQAPTARLVVVAADDGRTLAEALVPGGPPGQPPPAVRSRLLGPSRRASR